MNQRKYIEAPADPGHIYWPKSVFLGGSITGSHDWQREAADKLLPHFNVFNPRRKAFDLQDPSVEREQISWEHRYLNMVQIQLFYFSFETVAPITLLEYGAALESTKVNTYQKVYVALHPDYKRKNDVVIQTELRNPKWARNIRYNLDDTIQQIIDENADRPTTQI